MKLERSQRNVRNPRIQRMAEDLMKIRDDIKEELDTLVEIRNLVTDSGNEDDR